MTDTESPTPQTLTKRWLWRLGLGFLLLLALLVVFIIIRRITLSRKIDRALATAQAEGYPVTLAQLEQKYYPSIPDDDNAAPFFLNAFANLNVTNSGKNRLPELPDFQATNRSKFLSETNLDHVAKILEQNHDPLVALHQTPPATNCRYPLQISVGYGLVLSHLEPIRDSAHLLACEAVIHSRDGNTSQAIADFKAILQLSDSLNNEPTYLSQLVRLNIRDIAFRSAEYMLNLHSFTDAELLQLSRAIHEPENPAAMEHGLNLEICEAGGFFKMAGVKTPGTAGSSGPSGLGAVSPVFAIFNQLTGLSDRDYLFFVETSLEHLRITRTAFPQRLDLAKEWDDRSTHELATHNYFFSRMLLSALSRGDFRECAVDARINMFQTVLAIERYRLAHQNELPVNLSDLVPAFLNSVPTDPFDGKPLRYKKLAKGYMVYSIGENRKDDGGVYSPRAKPEAPADLTFVVER